jgi:hypothetical protein
MTRSHGGRVACLYARQVQRLPYNFASRRDYEGVLSRSLARISRKNSATSSGSLSV